MQSDDGDNEDELAPLTPKIAMAASPAASCFPDGQLHDADVIVEGLGFLSLLTDATRGPVSKVPLCSGAVLPASSRLWVASLSSDEDDDDEVLAPQTPSASAKDVVSASVLDADCGEVGAVSPCAW
jgi:hypothetical protein